MCVGQANGAGRVKAEKAARGFHGGLARGHARRNFREILFVLLGRKLGSRLAQRHGPAIVPLGWKRDAILTPAIAAHVNGFTEELRIGQRHFEPRPSFVMTFVASPPMRENHLAGCIRRRSGILSASFRNHMRKFKIIRCMEKRLMRKPILCITALMIAVLALPLAVVHAQSKDDAAAAKTEAAKTEQFKPEQQASKGSVTVGGTVINYDAFAGTLVVHPKDWDDVLQNAVKDDKSQPAEASMFYVAYFKNDSKRRSGRSPSSTTAAPVPRRCGCTWARSGRGAWSPRTTRTRRPRRTRWSTTSTACSMPPIWCSSTRPARASAASPARTRRRHSYGVDQDAHAFAEFITQFLSKYGRWNSPKYLFGESYGTHALGGSGQRAARPNATSISTA